MRQLGLEKEVRQSLDVKRQSAISALRDFMEALEGLPDDARVLYVNDDATESLEQCGITVFGTMARLI